MKSLTPPAQALNSIESFLDYRDSIGYNNERLRIEPLGFRRYHTKNFRYPQQRALFWEQFGYSMIDPRDFRFMTRAKALYVETLAHYLYTPLYPCPLGNSSSADMVPNALYLGSTRTIYLSEGSHRVAASLISGRALLMRLAPLPSLSFSAKLKQALSFSPVEAVAS